MLLLVLQYVYILCPCNDEEQSGERGHMTLDLAFGSPNIKQSPYVGSAVCHCGNILGKVALWSSIKGYSGHAINQG